LSPGDLEESARLGSEAFNLAEEYQMPVILLTDKYLAESRFSELATKLKMKVKINRGKLYRGAGKEDYERYHLTADGISPRAFPGQVAFLANSYEHDEHGFSTDDSRIRSLMMEKRAKKLSRLKGGFEVFGRKNPRIMLVGWGSTKEIILDVLKEFPDLGFIHFWRPWPFPKEAKAVLEKPKKIVSIEGNFSGQLADLLEKEAGLKVERILKDNGRPFFREELVSRFRKAIKND
jgi:2-oxoglutarate ferredoxin oxidoreductase subunit alpha